MCLCLICDVIYYDINFLTFVLSLCLKLNHWCELKGDVFYLCSASLLRWFLRCFFTFYTKISINEESISKVLTIFQGRRYRVRSCERADTLLQRAKHKYYRIKETEQRLHWQEVRKTRDIWKAAQQRKVLSLLAESRAVRGERTRVQSAAFHICSVVSTVKHSSHFIVLSLWIF